MASVSYKLQSSSFSESVISYRRSAIISAILIFDTAARNSSLVLRSCVMLYEIEKTLQAIAIKYDGYDYEVKVKPRLGDMFDELGNAIDTDAAGPLVGEPWGRTTSSSGSLSANVMMNPKTLNDFDEFSTFAITYQNL